MQPSESPNKHLWSMEESLPQKGEGQAPAPPVAHGPADHSPFRILRVRFQGHILTPLVDVDAHGMCGQQNWVLAHIRVLQILDWGTAFATLGSFHDWDT